MRKWAERLWRSHIARWLAPVIVAAAAVFVGWSAVYAVHPGWKFYLLLALAGGLTVWAEVSKAREKKSLVELDDELDHRQGQLTIAKGTIAQQEEILSSAQNGLDELVKRTLLRLAEKHNFRPTERITLFSSDGAEQRVVGRYCQATEYDHIGTRAYPSDYGLMGRAVLSGETQHEVRPRDLSYRQWQAKDGRLTIDAEIDALGMRSEAYTVIPLPQHGGGTTLGAACWRAGTRVVPVWLS